MKFGCKIIPLGGASETFESRLISIVLAALDAYELWRVGRSGRDGTRLVGRDDPQHLADVGHDVFLGSYGYAQRGAT